MDTGYPDVCIFRHWTPLAPEGRGGHELLIIDSDTLVPGLLPGWVPKRSHWSLDVSDHTT